MVDGQRVDARATATFRSLRERNFRLFVIGQAVSQGGTWMQMIGLTLLTLQLSGSGFVVGLVNFTFFGPTLVLGAWAGVLSDRNDRRRLLLGAAVAGLSVSAMLTALVLSDVIRLWMVVALSLAAGVVFALENPVRRAFVGELVEARLIPNAVAVNSAVMMLARVVGPTVASALIASGGVGWCFAINTLTFGPQLGLFARIDRARPGTGSRIVRARGQLLEGLRYAWCTPDLRLALILSLGLGASVINFQVIVPLYATRTLGGSETTFTLLFAAMSVGSVCGALRGARASRVDIPYALRRGAVLWAITCLLAVAPNLLASLAVSIVYGYVMVQAVAASNTVVQLTSAPSFRGRLLALYSVVLLGAGPMMSPLVGFVSDELGARVGLLVGSLGIGIASAVCLAVRHSSGASPTDKPSSAALTTIWQDSRDSSVVDSKPSSSSVSCSSASVSCASQMRST